MKNKFFTNKLVCFANFVPAAQIRRLRKGMVIKMTTIKMIETHSPEETRAFGERIGREARPGQVYTLIGDLGVGKTVFTQGVAAGLDISGPVNSPTFTILQVYEEGRLPFYHFDVYRIADVEEMEEIGCEDCFYGQGICLVEWADRIRDILPEHYIEITIEKDLQKGLDYRRITMTQGGYL